MKTNGIFSSRSVFDDATDMDSTYLYDSEVKELLPEVYNEAASRYPKDRLFIKIHDAYVNNPAGKPIVPSEHTLCALYFIRNPLDVVASLASHNAGSIEDALQTMNNPEGSLNSQKMNLNIRRQFKQLLLSWSGHVESWTSGLPFPVLVLRYEDMLHDTLNTFSKAAAFLGLEKSRTEIEKAIAKSSFEKLKEQENEKGFKERNSKEGSFFRSGKSGGWANELTAEQAKLIINNHRKTMEKYHYTIPDLASSAAKCV